MNEDERGDPLPNSELDTTVPNPSAAVPPPAGGWQMPEPKFQQTSGYLPQGYIDNVAFAANAPAPGAAAVAPAMAPAFSPDADVEPQPDLAEQLAEHSPPAPVPAPVNQRSSGARIVMIVLGLLGMVAFLAVFLGVIYYLFLAPRDAGSGF